MNEPVTAKSHGLDGSLVDPDWPPLNMDEVHTVLKKFPAVARPVSIISISPRPFSSASVIQTDRCKIFVKRHARSVRDLEGLAEEHRFMAHLRTRGICVPRVFPSESGSSAIELGGWTYEVHEIPAGEDLYEEALSWTPFQSAEHARSAGAMLARMHLAAANHDAPARKLRPLVASFTIYASEDPSAALETYLKARPALDHDPQTRADCKASLELLALFQAELRPLLPSLDPLWTHNDLHASNLFWSDRTPNARATSVIDFGLADRTNAVNDIAQAIERNIVDWLLLARDPGAGDRVLVDLDHLWALLDGYQTVRTLSLAEASALAPTLALSHAEFALSEADYFLGVLRSPERARVATHDYLVGHAQWFRNAGRENLLDPLRRWAESQSTRVVRA